MEVENTAAGVVYRDMAHGKRLPALSLAQEFELLAPEEFAQTGEIYLVKHVVMFLLFLEMQQILEQRDEAVNEK